MLAGRKGRVQSCVRKEGVHRLAFYPEQHRISKQEVQKEGGLSKAAHSNRGAISELDMAGIFESSLIYL